MLHYKIYYTNIILKKMLHKHPTKKTLFNITVIGKKNGGFIF
jgi:hypothetical protein